MIYGFVISVRVLFIVVVQIVTHGGSTFLRNLGVTTCHMTTMQVNRRETTYLLS
jgi:hypothetical protein